MTSHEEKEKHRRKRKRDAIKRDLMSVKYRQRRVDNKKRKILNELRDREKAREANEDFS